MMKLHCSPGACSLAPHIVLSELGLPHTLVKVDLRSHETEDGRDCRTINPKGYVPTLELDDGERLTEAAVLLQHVARMAARPGVRAAMQAEGLIK